MNRSKRGSDIRVGSLLKGYLEQHPAFAANPIGDWKDLVGEQVARYSSPGSLKNKVLVILVCDSVWKHHIEQYKELLAEKINAGRSEPIVEKIVVRVGEVQPSEPVLNPAHKDLGKIRAKRLVVRRKPKVPAGKLTTEEQLLIKKLPDPELRKMGEKLLRRIPASMDESESRTP
ncbi:MAG: DUF721 domain-containing protein [Deltaproteobacteria bacterium]|nr:DUF721 domain-containing protein [Deltaproteobacteria bacterium]